MHPDITDFIHLHPNHLPDRLADVMGHFHSNLWIHHNVQVHKKDRTALANPYAMDVSYPVDGEGKRLYLLIFFSPTDSSMICPTASMAIS